MWRLLSVKYNVCVYVSNKRPLNKGVRKRRLLDEDVY